MNPKEKRKTVIGIILFVLIILYPPRKLYKITLIFYNAYVSVILALPTIMSFSVTVTVTVFAPSMLIAEEAASANAEGVVVKVEVASLLSSSVIVTAVPFTYQVYVASVAAVAHVAVRTSALAVSV